MSDLELIRQGLADNLEAIDDIQVNPYILANPSTPCAEVMPAEVTYDQAMGRGLDDWFFTVRVLVGATGDQGPQKLLDKFLQPSGSMSIKEAIEADADLGGACEDLQVVSCSGYRVYERAGSVPVLGAEWRVRVLARGN